MKPNDSNTLYALHTNFNGSIEKISDKNGNVGKATPSPIPILISV